MRILGYFQIAGSSAYHIVYAVTVPGKTSKGFPKAWTLCGLLPQNRKGELDIVEDCPASLFEDTHLCLNCQAVQDSGMVRIHEFEAFLNRTPSRDTHPQCFGDAQPSEEGEK